jgi:hypothetical protein
MNDQEIDRWLDAALSAPAPSAPAGFTDRVMARVASAPRVSPVQTEALPWWIRLVEEPVTVLSLVVAGAVAWGWQGLWALAVASRAAIVHGVQELPAVHGLSASGALALEVALGSLIALSAGALFRAVGRLAGPIR